MSPQNAQDAGYDRKITSAETAARMEREGQDFKKVPESDQSQSSLDTTGGYTTDREGLLNNYPIEPEMYVNEPGDMRTKQDAEAVERALELEEINQEGGKGPGII